MHETLIEQLTTHGGEFARLMLMEWMVVRLDSHKRGRQMAFATLSVQVDERVVLRASAVPQGDRQ